MKTELENILLIGGHRKSGTTLLHSLFDAHPHVYAPPHDLNVLYAYYPEWTHGHYSKRQMQDRLRRVVLYDWLNSYFQYCRKREYQRIEACLIDYFEANITGVDLHDIQAVVDFSINLICSVAPKGIKTIVIKETSSEMYVPWLLGGREHWKFLHLFRDPRDNYAALKAGQTSYYGKLGDDDIDTLSSTIFRYKLGHAWKRANLGSLGGSRYKVLKFEDLTSKPSHEMRDIAAWLGIEWNENLQRPTRLGATFVGNSHDGQVFTDVSTSNVGRWTERLLTSEVSVLEFCLKDEMDDLGYASSSCPTDGAKDASEWYGKMNFRYFFSDRFADVERDSMKITQIENAALED